MSNDPMRASMNGQRQVGEALQMMNAIARRLQRHGRTVSNAALKQAMEDFAREADRMALGAREAIEAIRRLETGGRR